MKTVVKKENKKHPGKAIVSDSKGTCDDSYVGTHPATNILQIKKKKERFQKDSYSNNWLNNAVPDEIMH